MPSPMVWTSLRITLILTLLLAACGGSDQFTPLTADSPFVHTAEGLILSVDPDSLESSFGVKIDAHTPGPADSRWSTAFESLPPHASLQGPLFEIKTNGTLPQKLFLSVIIPTQADAARYDLYSWDGGEWRFLPAQARGGQLVASVASLPGALGLFEVKPTAPVAFAVVEPGQALDGETTSALNAVLIGGVFVEADGSLAGQLPAVPLDEEYHVYPVVRNYDSADINRNLLADVLDSPDLRANHLQELISFALSGEYAGLVLDYRAVDEALRAGYTAFVADLAAQLHAQGRGLFVQVEAPTPAGDGFETGGYDWSALGAAADAVLLRMPDDPAVYGSGQAAAVLAWAVGELPPSRLQLVTSAQSVDRAADRFSLRDYAAALEPLGLAAVSADAPPAAAGEAITVTLSGRAQSLAYDPNAFAALYSYTGEGEQAHTVWLVTADTLRSRLALAEKFHLGGVVVTGLAAPGAPAGLASAITEYKIRAAQNAERQVSLLWTVRDGSGVLAQATAQPGQPYVYVAQAPGTIEIGAELHNGQAHSLGSVGVSVAEARPTAAPTSAPITSGGGTTGGGTTGGGTTGGGGTSGGGSTGGGGFVPPPPISTGAFELGGQVPNFISHPNEMKQAGMTWVKFQARGDAGDFISAAHANGFKVLLSAVGDHARAADPGYWPEYAAWVAGMAAQGADAIEVWNEANIDREWPTGQISGVTYTELLKQAYNAIKAANPGTIVISGAPAPTGAEAAFPGRVMNDNNFLAQMASAGAANYMDCVGVHYNEGVVSPTQASGDPRDSFYSRYYPSMVDLYYGAFGGSRQLCFTELGYLTGEGYGPLPGFFAWAGDNTVAEQAQWLAEAASIAGNSGIVRMMIIFNVDFTLWGEDPQAGYAIIRPGGSCPACASLDAVMP